MKKETIHKAFEFSLFLKGLNGILEIAGGAVFSIVSLEKISRIIFFLTQNEISEDPRDFIANHLINFSRNLSINTQLFGGFYLISHGLIKIFLIIALWKRKLWAYPLATIIFTIFIAYQIFRYTYSNSFGLIVITLFDIFVIVSIQLEYRQLKKLVWG